MSAQIANYVQGIIDTQASMQSSVDDAYRLLTRYVFNPFGKREFSLLQQQNYGLPELAVGCILPITRFNMLDKDYKEMQLVPTDIDGNYQPVNEGVSKMKLTERRPADVVESLLEVFNYHNGTNGAQNNGFCEVTALLGSTDMKLLLDLNQFCLPVRFKTAREQIAHLEKAVKDASAPIFKDVALELLRSTLQAKTWADWYFVKLESDMKHSNRTGKFEPDPRDAEVCRWLEKQPPELRGNLMGEVQAVTVQQPQIATPSRATVQCMNCGSEANLLPNGVLPPSGCLVCKSPNFGRDEVELEIPLMKSKKEALTDEPVK